jgi:hypothetical protein
MVSCGNGVPGLAFQSASTGVVYLLSNTTSTFKVATRILSSCVPDLRPVGSRCNASAPASNQSLKNYQSIGVGVVLFGADETSREGNAALSIGYQLLQLQLMNRIP